MLHMCFSELRLPLELTDSQIVAVPQSAYTFELQQRAVGDPEDGYEPLELWEAWGTGQRHWTKDCPAGFLPFYRCCSFERGWNRILHVLEDPSGLHVQTGFFGILP